MDFLEDIFDNNKKNDHRNNYNQNKSYDNNKNNYKSSIPNIQDLLIKVTQNKSILISVVVVGIIFISFIIFALVLAYPFLLKLIYNIEKNGLRGIIELVMPMLQKLWIGTGKQ